MTVDSARDNPAIIIMAGGMGTRFWPASRESLPKQFLPICGSKPMVEESFLRIAALTEPRRILLIINARHRPLARKIIGDRRVRILEEPYGRNTAPCIGLGCIHVMKSFGDLPVIALPADHFISGKAEFRRSLRQGISLLEGGGIVTIGITPTYPETGYGYIEMGQTLSQEGAYSVNRFVEKPDMGEARGFLTSQNYLWNSGIFLFKASTMLREIMLHLPQTGRWLNEISKTIDTDRYSSTLEEAYREMESISIDYGIMEKTEEPIHVIKGDFGWSDVGNWAAVRRLREAEKDGDGNVVSGKALLLDTKKALVHSQTHRLIAVLGLSDLLIVDTDDVLLVADINESQGVRRFSETLQETDWSECI